MTGQSKYLSPARLFQNIFILVALVLTGSQAFAKSPNVPALQPSSVPVTPAPIVPENIFVSYGQITVQPTGSGYNLKYAKGNAIDGFSQTHILDGDPNGSLVASRQHTDQTTVHIDYVSTGTSSYYGFTHAKIFKNNIANPIRQPLMFTPIQMPDQVIGFDSALNTVNNVPHVIAGVVKRNWVAGGGVLQIVKQELNNPSNFQQLNVLTANPGEDLGAGIFIKPFVADHVMVYYVFKPSATTTYSLWRRDLNLVSGQFITPPQNISGTIDVQHIYGSDLPSINVGDQHITFVDSNSQNRDVYGVLDINGSLTSPVRIDQSALYPRGNVLFTEGAAAVVATPLDPGGPVPPNTVHSQTFIGGTRVQEFNIPASNFITMAKPVLVKDQNNNLTNQILLPVETRTSAGFPVTLHSVVNGVKVGEVLIDSGEYHYQINLNQL
jgi:hypothetical protein